MHDVISCPYCFRESQHGIRVCQGCGAEVHYGAPKEAYSAAMLAAIFSALYFAVTFNALSGGAAFVIVLFAISKFVNQKYKDRIVFKRIFHTQR